MRRDFLSRQKQWELDQARAAPEVPSIVEDEGHVEKLDYMEGKCLEAVFPCTSSHFLLAETEMVDQILSDENREIEELISSLQHTENQEDIVQPQYPMSDYGSDDDEYDQLFMEVVLKEDSHAETPGVVGSDYGHEMDMSFG